MRFFFLATSILLMISCNNNPCSNPGKGENFILSDASKSYLLQYENADTIIFIDKSGNEVPFSVSGIEDFTSEYQFSGICQNDPSRNQTFIGSSQVIQLFLSNPSEISEPLYVTLSELPAPPDNNNVKETLDITLGDLFSNDKHRFAH
ncbi:MAG: hypothetical protein R3A50_14575 [Saprospiraceae bacterium]|nr:hypothetical protein [Saprospiraceae bacterium]MCB9343139.1 hypothetical protein [Lewinellaceae bacterium]